MPVNLKKAAPFLLFLVITLVTSWECVFLGKTFFAVDFLENIKPWASADKQKLEVANYLHYDIIEQVYPRYQFINNSLKKGDFPLWNPYIFCGYPDYATHQLTQFYPLTLLLNYFCDVFTAYLLFLIIHIFFSGVCMFLLIRSMDCSNLTATFAAVVWMLCGQSTVWFKYTFMLVVMVFLPLTLYLVNIGFKKGRIAYFLLASLSLATGMIGTHPQLALFMQVITLLFFVYYLLSTRRWLLCLRNYTIVLIFSLLLSSAQLLPFFENLLLGQRQPLTIWDVSERPYTLPLFFPLILLPRIFGSPIDRADLVYVWSKAKASFFEIQGYIGFLPFIFIFFAFKHRDRVFSRLAFVICLCCLILALNPHIYFFITYPAGFLASMMPTRLFFVYSFFAIMLAAMGLERIIQNFDRINLTKVGIILLVIAAVAFIGLCANRLLLEFRPGSSILKWANITNPAFFIPLILCGLCGLLFLLKVVTPKFSLNAFFAGVVLLVIVDLLPYFMTYNKAINPLVLRKVVKEIEYLHKNKDDSRFVEDNRLVDWDWPFTNLFIPYGLLTPEGSSGLIPQRYYEVATTAMAQTPGARQIVYTNYASTLLDLMSVKYVMLDKPLIKPHLKLKSIYNENCVIYENKSCLPRAFVVYDYKVVKDKRNRLKLLSSADFDPAEIVLLEQDTRFVKSRKGEGFTPAEIVRYSNQEAVIEVETWQDGILVFSDSYYPGWRCYVDGKEVPILVTNHAFRGVEIQAGRHQVRFLFEPVVLKIGVVISAVALVVCVIWIVLSLKRYG